MIFFARKNIKRLAVKPSKTHTIDTECLTNYTQRPSRCEDDSNYSGRTYHLIQQQLMSLHHKQQEFEVREQQRERELNELKNEVANFMDMKREVMEKNYSIFKEIHEYMAKKLSQLGQPPPDLSKLEMESHQLKKQLKCKENDD